jgi:hypothetical protein
MEYWKHFFGVSTVFEPTQLLSPSMALDVFKEEIDFSIASSVPIPRPFLEIVQEKIASHTDWVMGEQEKETISQVFFF